MSFSFLCHFNRVGMSVAGTERLMAEFHLSPEEMGAVYSAYLLIYTLAMMPGGWLIERYGPRVALGLMGFCAGALAILTGLPGWRLLPAAMTLPALMLVRGVLGLASAPMHPGGARSISFWMPATRRAWGNGMVTGAALVGVAATYKLFGILMDWLSWPGAFAAVGLVTLLVATVWLVTTANRPESNRSEDFVSVSSDDSPPDNGGRPLLDRSLVLLTVSYAVFGYFQYLFMYWMQYYFKEVLGLSTDESRQYSTIVSLAMAAGMVGGGFLSDRLQLVLGNRWGRSSVAMAGMIGSALFGATGVHLTDPILVVGCFALAMGILGMCEGPFWTTAVELGGRRGGLSAAILNTGGNIGGMLSPFTTPLIARYFNNFQVGIELACLFSLIGAILWCWIKPGNNHGN